MKQTDLKRKPCLLNVTHNQNSSKNINININYNLSSPKYPQSLKGRKIQRLMKPIQQRSSDCMKHSIKQSGHNFDLSLKLVKKKNQERLEGASLVKSRTGKIQKPKKKIEVEFPMTTTAKAGRERRLFTDYDDVRGKEDREREREKERRFEKSLEHVRTKSEPRARLDSDALRRLKKREEKPLSEEKPKRNKNKSTILDRNKTEIDLKQKSKGKKKRDSIKQIPIKPKAKKSQKQKQKQKQKQRQPINLKKPSKKPTKRRFFSHIDFQPFIMSKFLSSSVISDQINASEKQSKENTDRQSASLRPADTINVFKNTNSIELVSMNEIRKFEKEAKMKMYADEINKRYNYDKAADVIKKCWKQYFTRKIIKYYNSVFEKNSKEEYFEEFSEIKEKSQIRGNEEEQGEGEEEKEQEEQNEFHLEEFIPRKKQNESPGLEEQDTYFDIKKYQKMVKKTLEQDSKQKIADSKSSSKANSRTNSPRNKKDLSHQQMQQWDNINQLLKNQFNKSSTQADEHKLLNELMKQSEYNRKWIEQGSPEPMRQKEQLQKQQDKQQSNQRIEFHSKTYDFDQNISSRIQELMNNELMNNSESQTHIRTVHDMRGEDIDNYLDCGLDTCGFQTYYDLSSNKLERKQARDINSQPSLREGIQQNNSEQQSPGALFETHNNYLSPQPHQLDKINDFQSLTFEEIYDMILDELCEELTAKGKIQKMCMKYMRKLLVQTHSKYSIKTNNVDIKAYIDGLIKYVLENKEERAITLRNINCTLGPTSKQMLYYLRIEDYQAVEEQEDKQESLFVISLDTFQRFEEVLVRSGNLNAKQQMYEHFWHRALFEGLNQALDQHRPYGTYGKPYDWQIVAKLRGKKILNDELQSHLLQSNLKLLEVANYMGGVIQEKETNQFVGMGLTDEDYEQINQERVSRILADELIEEEETWINYLDEKVEIQLQVIELVEESFLLEVGRDLKKIQLRRAFTNDN